MSIHPGGVVVRIWTHDFPQRDENGKGDDDEDDGFDHSMILLSHQIKVNLKKATGRNTWREPGTGAVARACARKLEKFFLQAGADGPDAFAGEIVLRDAGLTF